MTQQDAKKDDMERSRRALSQSQPSLLKSIKSRQSRSGYKTAGRLISGLKVGSLLKTWENVSKINFLSMATLNAERPSQDGKVKESAHSLRRRSIGMPPKENLSLQNFFPIELRNQSEQDLFAEQFPVNVTPLMNEDQLWGCFYMFPELYTDEYSPVVKIRELKEVPDLVGGVLTREMIAVCLSYLKRNPILGDYVFIKLDLSNKHLVNIEVLQHYKYLVYLDLSSNYLTELKVLSNLLYLQYLSVSFNRLSTVLDYEVPQWFLTEVHYKFNSVKRIRDLTMFWSITILDLSHNNIKCISGLENMFYLRRLDLSFNHIQRLENLNDLRLVWLDVSYNNISNFEFTHSTGLWTLLHLEYLNLNENNLTSMKIFSGCTRLQELHCRNNRLKMLLELAVYMRQLRRLTILDLRANPVCSTPGYKEVVVSTFPKLLCLDAEELDPVELRNLKNEMNPDVRAFSCHRLLRLLYIEQLSRSRVSPFVPPADTTEVPMVIFVGYEAVGKGTLARRLAKECPEKIELAIQTTTASYHHSGHYREVTRSRFDDMLIAGELMTYTEMDGESYGLSREEAFIRNGKVRVACMDLPSAMMMDLRGRRPFLILTTCADKVAMKKRQQERKLVRSNLLEGRTSVEMPIEKSTLQILISGRILVTGILNEILMTLPEEKVQSEFLIESQCSLLMDSAARQAAEDRDKGVNMLTFMCSSTTSFENACQIANQKHNETSLYSLYKESQGTDEYASDIGQNLSYSNSKRSGSNRYSSKIPAHGNFRTQDKTTSISMSGANSAKSSKSVTFTSQDGETYGGPSSNYKESTPRDKDEGKQSVPRALTGLMVEPMEHYDPKSGVRSLSKKFPWAMRPGRTASTGSIDDGDLWLTFLVETGLLQSSDPNLEEQSDHQSRHETRLDDPEFILKLLAIYRATPGSHWPYNIAQSVRDDYEDIHHSNPGLFWDCITMDDPDAAFYKAKRIIRSIVENQCNIKPMFYINFTESRYDDHPIIKRKLQAAANRIAPKRFFY